MKTADTLSWSDRVLRDFNPAVGFAVLAIACLLIVGWVRISSPAPKEAIIVATTMRTLQFIDQPDGSINVVDSVTRNTIENFSGEQGFLRGTLRALVRERKLRNIAATDSQAFELIAHDGGRLTLRDPTTGSSIALESFGSTNAAVFGRLLR